MRDHVGRAMHRPGARRPGRSGDSLVNRHGSSKPNNGGRSASARARHWQWARGSCREMPARGPEQPLREYGSSDSLRLRQLHLTRIISCKIVGVLVRLYRTGLSTRDLNLDSRNSISAARAGTSMDIPSSADACLCRLFRGGRG